MKKNTECIKAFQALMNKGDTQSAFKLIHPNASWQSDEIGAPWSGHYQGIEAIKSHFKAIAGTTKDFKRYTDKWIEEEELVIEIGGLSCILTKTEKPFKTEYVCLYSVQDNQITSYRIFEDSLKLSNAYYSAPLKKAGLKFSDSVATLKDDDTFLHITQSQINAHFPASSPGAIRLFIDNYIAVGMVRTEDHPPYPHHNQHDEVHYVIKGSASFRCGNRHIKKVSEGDVVYVKTPSEHEWYNCSPDFELIFVQAGVQQEG